MKLVTATLKRWIPSKSYHGEKSAKASFEINHPDEEKKGSYLYRFDTNDEILILK